jgi:hypothetical protein
MFISTKSKPYRKIHSSEKHFHFSPDGIKVVPRAGIEISQRCPENYQHLIQECLHHGWLRPVAYMLEEEVMWHELKS